MEKYKDIINLPHKQSSKRPRMSLLDRAAQFAPFAALVGHDDAIKETGRLTDERIEMSEEKLAALNARYQILVDRLSEEPEVTITYFVPDIYKNGGSYITKTSVVKKLDSYERLITMVDGTRILMDDVLTLEGDVFSAAEPI
ncbi:MAG: hypothetical protein IJD81_05880 [Oscillospiraceae bacterium]|nr:hypothetical protein [Oscillospiraceae bacterium]